jgi:hypothetical protein
VRRESPGEPVAWSLPRREPPLLVLAARSRQTHYEQAIESFRIRLLDARGSVLEFSDRFLSKRITATSSPRRSNILIHPEEVVRVVLLLDVRETLIVIPVTGLHALLPLVHHEVHIRASSRVAMQSLP